MRNAIIDFANQLEYEPDIVNKEKLKKRKSYIVAGMGGSGLPAGIVKMWNPACNVFAFGDYGLPRVPECLLEDSLIVATSYSGNTEEVVSVFDEVVAENKYSLAVITTGGDLLDRAKRFDVPYIQLPDIGIQPRSAIGFGVIALLSVMGDNQSLVGVKNLSKTINPMSYESVGIDLSEKLRNKIPVIYASEKNKAIAYNWKIKFNENTKIPAFANTLPELSHNEIAGYDVVASTEKLMENICVLMLRDKDDDQRIQKRFDVTERICTDKGIAVVSIDISGSDKYEKTFASIMKADWTSVYLADYYGNDPESIPVIENFKSAMRN